MVKRHSALFGCSPSYRDVIAQCGLLRFMDVLLEGKETYIRTDFGIAEIDKYVVDARKVAPGL